MKLRNVVRNEHTVIALLAQDTHDLGHVDVAVVNKLST